MGISTNTFKPTGTQSHAHEAADTHWMRTALSLAYTASKLDEVPVGAVVVKDNLIIGTGMNLRESFQTACGHAEIEAIAQANTYLNSWRLVDCTLYVTLEPCIMCAGALIQSRISRVVYGTKDPKGGAIGSLYNLASDIRLNHQISVRHGVLEQECSSLLKSFFRNKRSPHSTR